MAMDAKARPTELLQQSSPSQMISAQDSDGQARSREDGFGFIDEWRLVPPNHAAL